MKQTDRLDEVARLYRQGLSSREIGARLGMAPATVIRWLHRQFEPVRPKHHAIAIKSDRNLTAELVRSLICYDPATGRMTWRVTRGPKARAGDQAGVIDKGRWNIGICGRVRLAHRVIWLYMTGDWPKYDIDHINGDATDNRWVNLRDVETRVNVENQRKANKKNKTGFLGVRFVKSGKRKPYVAKIGVHGKSIYLGGFGTPEEAHEAYIRAKRKYHEGCTL